jgi:hypothetical protein
MLGYHGRETWGRTMDDERRNAIERTYDRNGELWSEVERGRITRENLDQHAARLATQLTAATMEAGATPTAEEWREYLDTLIDEVEEIRGGG